jgi:uncharacterized membrane protein (DUF2068 family)
MAKLWSVDDRKLKEMGAGTFFYAGLFLTEGIGLWFAKRWGEWCTVIITGSLIPFECYEMISQPSGLKSAVLFVNIAIVAYLIRRIIHEPHSRSRQSTSVRMRRSRAGVADGAV